MKKKLQAVSSKYIGFCLDTDIRNIGPKKFRKVNWVTVEQRLQML